MPEATPTKVAAACLLALLISITLSACDKVSAPVSEKKTDAPPTVLTTPDYFKAKPALVEATQAAALNALAPSLEHAAALQQAITALLAEPNAHTLAAAQAQWHQGVSNYRQFTLFKHIALVDPKTFSRLNRLDYQISAYPIQPGFIDSFGDYQYSGLVHDIGFPITEQSLQSQHGLTDLGEVILGFYAIEFLLFNVDGKRNLEDFAYVAELSKPYAERGFEKLEEIPNNRRRELLKKQGDILNNDLQELHMHWTATDPTGAAALLNSLSDRQCALLFRRALMGTLTQIMLEIGGLNQEAIEDSDISPMIFAASFKEKQAFINNALKSALVAETLINDGQLKAELLDPLRAAIALTDNIPAQDTEQEKAYWGEVFTLVKQASDTLP